MELSEAEATSLKHIATVLATKLFEVNPGLEDYKNNNEMVGIVVKGLDSNDDFVYEVVWINLDHTLVTRCLEKDPTSNCIVIFENLGDDSILFGVTGAPTVSREPEM